MSQAREHQPGIAPLVWAWVLAFLLPLASGAAATNPPLTRVVFLPHWIPQAQFAGYYIAAEKGFYRQHGLEVLILDGGPRKPVDKLLASGKATFASHFLSSALRLREQGVPLVHLAQITQRSALMLVAHKSHGIQSVRDLDGKKVSLWKDFTAQPEALFRKYHLQVQTLPQGPTINLFMRGGVDAASAMWYNEYHLFLDSGLDPNEVTLFFFNQYGLNFPEDALLCLSQAWRSRPELCRQFVQASLEGWRYVLTHRAEALEVVMQRAQHARTGSNRSHQRWMLECMCELLQPVEAGVQIGQLSRGAYAFVVQELKACGQLSAAPSYEQFHVPVFR